MKPKFSVGQKVYLAADTDQGPQFITGIMLRQGGIFQYEISTYGHGILYYDFEINEERDITLTTSN